MSIATNSSSNWGSLTMTNSPAAWMYSAPMGWADALEPSCCQLVSRAVWYWRVDGRWPGEHELTGREPSFSHRAYSPTASELEVKVRLV